ncbi:MAG TPA: hypothetical protein VFB38_19555 [Chthonomonadaceae bacterium]|nr:hypothetical protein [Chthonomonadaceae bacterium]
MEVRAWVFSEDGEFVERACLLFEAGEYPDKGVAITEDDLRAVAANSGERVPVKIEHLPESPFDGALGVVTDLRVVGKQLWGTLRQPVEAWRLAQRAGARALSVELDVAKRRLVETSFVCRPRVKSAQVFSETGVVEFTVPELFAGERGTMMTGVRQFAEGLMVYLRGFLGGEEGKEADRAGEAARFALEREQMAEERARFRVERVEQQIREWKRQGCLRATERAERLARTLLMRGEESLVEFDAESVPLSGLFARFMAENGPVVPLGEAMRVDRYGELGRGRSSGERLVALARERARQEGLSYVQSFALVAAEHPDLAQAAREE